MQSLIVGFACHGCLLFVLSILTLTLASQLPNEEPFGAEITERPNTEPPSTMGRQPLPNEMWRLILEKCELAEYFHFLLAYPEMQSLRLTEAVEFDILEKAFQKLHCIGSTLGKFDYENYESIVAAIRGFIHLSSGQPLVEDEAVPGADEEVRNKVVRLADKFCEKFGSSRLARRILFSALMEHLHGADIGMDIFAKYRNDILHAAALNGNYDQLRALVDKSKLGWNRAARVVMSAIAQSGSVELFDKVLQVVSRQALMQDVFYGEIIRFNKQELFLELVLQLQLDIDGTDLTILHDIFWICCQHERQELVRVLIKHKLNSLVRINLMNSFLHVIKIGNMDIFTMLLGDSESPSLWKSSLLNHFWLLNTASFYNRVDIVRLMLSLDEIDDSARLNAFSRAVLSGSIELMELLLGAQPNGRMWISTFSCILDDMTINTIGHSGRSDVVEFFLHKRDDGDARFDGFSVGMRDNQILCSACFWGKHELVKYLLRRHEETNEFIFPDVNPAARNNYPLQTGTGEIEIVKELLRQDEHGGMIYPGVAVTHNVLLYAAATDDCEALEFLLQTVRKDDGSVQYKFPGIDLGAKDYDLLDYLVSIEAVDTLEFLLRRDALGSFVLPGVEVPERLVDSLDALGVLWRT